MKLLYFIVLTGLCMACHQPRVYRINGSLPGALDGYVVKLYNIDTYPDVLLDFLRIIRLWNSSVRWTVCRAITGNR